MPFIGNQPTSGRFLELDSLTASATDDYTLQLNGANFEPESVNNLLVSINGVIQGSSTMSLNGAVLTVGATLSSSDTIDFVRVFGNVGTVSTPTDGSVTANKIGTGAVTSAKIADDAVVLTSKVSGVLPVANGGTGLASKPIYQGYRAGQYSTTSSIIPTDVRINQGGHYNTSTHVWTCPKNGFYVVGVNGLDNSAINIHLRKNGVKWKTSIYATQTSGWASYADHEVLQLTANDTLDHYLVTGRVYSDSDHYYQAYIYLLE